MRLRRLVPVAAAMLLAVTAALADGQVNFFLGQKALDGGDWDPIDRQAELGAMMSFGKEAWPLRIAADVLIAGRDGTLPGSVDVKGATFEVASGIRKIWGKKAFHPFAGAGIAIVGAQVELDNAVGSADDTDVAFGPWIDGGVFWRLGMRFNLGLDVRWSKADVHLDFGDAVGSDDLDAGGLHYGLLLGFGW
ncbi:MAG TPA: hypothetical protein VJ826_16840 [Candidatus Polarisedimenticolaceae bacterium]|nr:hypothetical protein [Candidatus Polarisedimenticolaceae bacterium]